MLSAKDIESGKILIPQDCRRISIEDYNSIFKNYNLKINDILLTIVGTIGRVAMVDNLTNKYALQRSVAIIRVNSLNHPLFIFYLLQTNNIKKQYYSKMNQSAQGGIYLDSLNKLSFKNTILSEQEKIAKFLSIVDKRIEKQRQLVESLKKYKRGYLKALIKKLNTTEFLLENIVEEYQNKTILNMQYPILSSTMNGIKLQDDYFNKQAASENTIGYKIVPKGYFTYRSMSDTGVFRFNRQMLVCNGIVSPAYPVFKVKSEEANPIFVEYMLNEDDKIKEQLLTQKEGGTRYALSFSKFKSLKINLPDINIQEKIAIQITLLNTLVKKQEAYLHCLNKNKCGLLQQMFI